MKHYQHLLFLLQLTLFSFTYGKFTNIYKATCYSTPNLNHINVTFMGLKSLFKTSSRNYILLFHDTYRQFFFYYFVFEFASMTSKFSWYYNKCFTNIATSAKFFNRAVVFLYCSRK